MQLAVNNEQVGEHQDGLAGMGLLRFLHRGHLFLYLVRTPFVVLVAKEIIVGLDGLQETEEVVLGAVLTGVVKDNEVVMFRCILFQNSARLVLRPIIMDVDSPILEGLLVEGVYLLPEICLSVICR